MRQILVFWTLIITVALGENVSVNVLSGGFTSAVNTIGGPSKLAVNVPTQKFARDFTLATGNLLIDLVLEYYRQARLASIILANEWKSCSSRLFDKLTQVPENNSEYLDRYLNDVSKRVENFLLMQPGILEAKSLANYPKLPTRTGRILTHYENYEPGELFNNLETLVDQDLSSIHNFVEKIYLTGWQGARLSLGKVQQQFRDEFLHCTFLKIWLDLTSKIDGAGQVLRNHVRPESWREYEKLSERVRHVGETIGFDQEFCQTRV